MSTTIPDNKDIDLAPLDVLLQSFESVTSGDLIPVLQKIQAAYGYLPRRVLLEMSKRTSIPASTIYGVATFYEQFHLEPHGRHTVRCCRGTACHVKGGPNITKTVERLLGVSDGQTTENMRFTFETVACLGTCFLAPAMMINNDYYGRLNVKKLKSILDGYS
jgi:NADH-quinone oxidoreductase subunit E